MYDPMMMVCLHRVSLGLDGYCMTDTIHLLVGKLCYRYASICASI